MSVHTWVNCGLYLWVGHQPCGSSKNTVQDRDISIYHDQNADWRELPLPDELDFLVKGDCVIPQDEHCFDGKPCYGSQYQVYTPIVAPLT